MKLRRSLAPGLLGLLVLGGAGCSSSEPPPQACSINVDCPAAQLCADTGVCDPVAPLTLTDPAELPAAVKGVPYSVTLAVTGGAPPKSFNLAQLPPALSWLRIDVANGTLSGTPTEAVTSPVVFQVSVTDESRQEATKSFQLSVDLCADGDVVECFAPTSGESCGHGTATCSGGAPGACQVASSSASADHCGGACDACAAGEACVNGKCACGDGPPCVDGRICCSDSNGEPACVDPQSDSNNCGVCGRSCASDPNTTTTCVQGTCSNAVICATGFGNCDTTNPTSCSTPLTTDSNNCGACGNACDAQRSDACANGLCACADGTECAPGDDCCPSESGLDAGCVDPLVGVQTDVGIERCGGCGAPLCPKPAGAGHAVCSGGDCGAACEGPYADCNVSDGATPHDCITNLDNDPSHCGSCGTSCPDPSNGSPVCSGGSCDVACGTGFCRRVAVDGEHQCLDESNNGSCGESCNLCAVYTNPLTVTGSSTCCSGISASKGECSGVCNPSTNPKDCVCGVVCAAGQGNCDGDVTNGCEKSLVADTANCGACGNICTTSVSHATAICGGGTCGFACQAGYFKCNGQCIPLNNNDPNNCGACGTVCGTPSNGARVCNAGHCDFTCSAGYLKCGTSCVPIDDPNNCGSCGNQCPTYSDPDTGDGSYCRSDGKCCEYSCENLPCQTFCN